MTTKINAFERAENFLKQGWNPKDYTLDGYLAICNDINQVFEELKAADRNFSDEKYNEAKAELASRLEDLLQ